jgi:hypothetical protein
LPPRAKAQRQFGSNTPDPSWQSPDLIRGSARHPQTAIRKKETLMVR